MPVEGLVGVAVDEQPVEGRGDRVDVTVVLPLVGRACHGRRDDPTRAGHLQPEADDARGVALVDELRPHHADAPTARRDEQSQGLGVGSGPGGEDPHEVAPGAVAPGALGPGTPAGTPAACSSCISANGSAPRRRR